MLTRLSILLLAWVTSGCFLDVSRTSLNQTTESSLKPTSICEANSLAQTYNEIGNGDSSSPYILCTAAQIASLAKTSSAWSYKFELGSNIDLAEYDQSAPEKTLNPIGVYDSITAANLLPFTGIFDGKGYKISNLKLTAATNQGGAFFGYTLNAQISNLTLENVTIQATRFAGALVAYNKSTPVDNVHVSGNVYSNNWYVGGLIGFNDGSGAGKSAPVSNSTSSVNITGDTCIGGFIGWNTGITGGSANISNSSSSGTVSSTVGNTIAGFISYNIADGGGTVNISKSFSTGNVSTVTGGSFSGAFVGTNRANGAGSQASISDSYTTGNLEFPASLNAGFVGGLVGHTTTTLGGKAQILRSYYSGSIHITTGAINRGYIGALVGYIQVSGATSNGDIEDSYALGSIQIDSTGGNNTGGLIGHVSRASSGVISITRTFASVTISGASLAASIGGWNGTYAGGSPTVTNSFWNTDARASGSSQALTGITGATANQLRAQATFTGWNFSTMWSITEGVGFPRLR